MSVFQMGTADTDKLFLEYILPGLTVQIRENTILFDRFKTDTESVAGKYAVFKSMTKSPKSVRPSSSSTLPTPKQGTYNEFLIYMKRGMYASLQFDGLALACSKGKGAVMGLLKAELQGINIQMANKFNRQYWGDGSGRLAQLNAASTASTTVVVDGPLFGQDSNEYTNPAHYLDEGMSVDIYSSTGTLEAEDIDISTIVDNGDGTATLTMASAVTATNNAYIFDHDTYASSEAAGTGVPMGIYGIIATANPYIGITASSAFQNINRTSAAWAQAQDVDMANAALTSRKIMDLIFKVEKFGRVKVLITNEIIYKNWADQLAVDRTLPNETALWSGVEGLTFLGGRKGKIPIIHDQDCPDGLMYAIDDDLLMNYSPVQNGLAWIPGENGILTRVAGKDEWVAALVNYNNFGSPKPQGLGRLRRIKHATS